MHAAGAPDPSHLSSTRHALKGHLDQALANVTDYAIVLIDPHGRIADWNPGAQRLLGHTAARVIGQPFDILFTPEDLRSGAPAQELAAAERTGSAEDDRWHVRSDGSRFFGSGIVNACRDHDRNLVGFIKVFRDLSERQRWLEHVADTESRYRLLVDSIQDYAIYMLDADGRVKEWTKSAERIKGYSADDVLGQSFAMFFTPEDRATREPERELQAARDRGRAERTGWRVRKDGSRFWGDEVATALFDPSGTVVGFCKITRDSSERRRIDLERELLLSQANENNRLKDEFLGTVSHELRTPLNAILGWLQAIRTGRTGKSLEKGLAVLERNARAQMQLVTDLLDMSRVVVGKIRLTLQPITLSDPLDVALDTVRPMAEQHGVEIVVHRGVSPDHLIGDAARLQQVIWNLLSNAIKFTPRGGTVRVTTTTTADDALELTVTDTGVGIDPAFLPFVFDRFRQADSTYTKSHGGLGLGLSIVKHLVDLHHGHIAIESDGQNRGTCVRLSLPRSLDREASPDPGGAPMAGLATPTRRLEGVTVLLIDDDADARQVVQLVLTAEGARVQAAASSQEGVSAVHISRPDVVLADVSLSVEGGFGFVRRLRTDSDADIRALPVVAVTANARIEDREVYLGLGFDAYLAKPIDMNAVVSLLADLVVRK